jgi:hypothetical protein
MGKGGKVNSRELENFRKNLQQQLSGTQLDLFIESCAKELAARLLAKVVKRTPVGQYPSGSGKTGGTLRRGWTGETQQNASEYAGNLKVHHYGGTYVIEIVNPVEYASYVEFGHRTRGGEGWVKGKFMLSISEGEIQRDAPRVLENKLKKKLGECFK